MPINLRFFPVVFLLFFNLTNSSSQEAVPIQKIFDYFHLEKLEVLSFNQAERKIFEINHPPIAGIYMRIGRGILYDVSNDLLAARLQGYFQKQKIKFEGIYYFDVGVIPQDLWYKKLNGFDGISSLYIIGRPKVSKPELTHLSTYENFGIDWEPRETPGSSFDFTYIQKDMKLWFFIRKDKNRCITQAYDVYYNEKFPKDWTKIETTLFYNAEYSLVIQNQEGQYFQTGFLKGQDFKEGTFNLIKADKIQY